MTRLDLTISTPILYNSKVQAGFPSPADGYMDTKLDLNEYLIDHPVTTFFVRVAGDSMIETGILENDILIVDRSITPINDKIVIAVINSEFTVKRLKYINNQAYLIPENKNYAPILIKTTSEDDGVYIWGVVTSVVRKL